MSILVNWRSLKWINYVQYKCTGTILEIQLNVFVLKLHVNLWLLLFSFNVSLLMIKYLTVTILINWYQFICYYKYRLHSEANDNFVIISYTKVFSLYSFTYKILSKGKVFDRLLNKKYFILIRLFFSIQFFSLRNSFSHFYKLDNFSNDPTKLSYVEIR